MIAQSFHVTMEMFYALFYWIRGLHLVQLALKKARELDLQILPTKNKLVQVDESYLEVCGEVHLKLHRDSLSFSFSALVVKKMGFNIIGGTNFFKENDIYCRLSTNKIVIKGIHSYNSTPYVATLNKMGMAPHNEEKNIS